jgi:hypothetical protein
MWFTDKGELSKAAAEKLAQAWHFPVIPQEKISELMDAAIMLMRIATILLKLALFLAPLTVAGMLIAKFMEIAQP